MSNNLENIVPIELKEDIEGCQFYMRVDTRQQVPSSAMIPVRSPSFVVERDEEFTIKGYKPIYKIKKIKTILPCVNAMLLKKRRDGNYDADAYYVDFEKVKEPEIFPGFETRTLLRS
jgi:hypothetical protein